MTSPLPPELIVEGESIEDALENVQDDRAAVVEAYRETGRRLPTNLVIADLKGPVWAERVVAVP